MRFGAFRLDVNLQIKRFGASVGRSSFINTVWNFFRLAGRISSFLDTFDRCRLFLVSSTVHFDAIETSLGVTEEREQLEVSDSANPAIGSHLGRPGSGARPGGNHDGWCS